MLLLVSELQELFTPPKQCVSIISGEGLDYKWIVARLSGIPRENLGLAETSTKEEQRHKERLSLLRTHSCGSVGSR